MPSDLKTQLQQDLVEARKGRDRPRMLVLSTTLSEMHNREIELGSELDDEHARIVLGRAIKQRRDAARLMREGGRDELADKEEAEVAILQAYLPPELTEDEVRELVRAAIASGADGMGPIMGRVMPKIMGRFDGKAVNRIVRDELAG